MFGINNPPSITPPTEGIQNMMGIQNVAAIFCVPLIPYCWDTKYGNHILYPLKDQRGDTEYGRHTEYGFTPVYQTSTTSLPHLCHVPPI